MCDFEEKVLELFKKNLAHKDTIANSNRSLKTLSLFPRSPKFLSDIEDSEHLEKWQEIVRFFSRERFDLSLKEMKSRLERVASGAGDKKGAVFYIARFLERFSMMSKNKRAPVLTEEMTVRLFKKQDIPDTRDSFSNIFQKEKPHGKKLRFKPELVYKQWCFDMLESLFGKEEASPYIKDKGRFDQLKTSQGFERICREGDAFIERRVIPIGVRNKEGKLAWEQIKGDFLSFLQEKKLKFYANQVLDNVLAYLREKSIEERKLDEYMLSVMYALYDDLKGKKVMRNNA